ncbi:MAG: envelope integrity protein Cei [Pseudonocardia sp.]|nr:envelope integrity protein Cei [Pseudonocardia sp.]
MGVRPYQRRRRGPIVALVAVLAVVAATTWTVVLLTSTTGTRPVSCPAPPGAQLVGEVLESDGLDDVAPIPAASVGVRVFNAGGQRGQANLVAAQLTEWGFAEVAPPANDPRFPEGDMECIGQLRFGPAGAAAASTVSLVLPCVELVSDGRADPSVDLSVGTAFGALIPHRYTAGLNVLEQLAEPDQGGTGATNADPAQAEAPPAVQAVDPDLLQRARAARCS